MPFGNVARAELLLLSLDRRKAHELHRRASQRDASARSALDSLWAQHRELTFSCFLCDAAMTGAHWVVLDEPAAFDRAVAVPLCETCYGHPGRDARVMKMLRTMHKAKTGKDIHFQVPRHEGDFGYRR